MKKMIISALLVAGTTVSSFGQDFKTSDKEFDTQLQKVNSKALADLTAFKNDLSKQLNVPLRQVEECFAVGMRPADALMALNIAESQKIPVGKVIDVYKTNKEKGWGEMAKELGIKPGSPEFHALKGKTKNGVGTASKAPDNKPSKANEKPGKPAKNQGKDKKEVQNGKGENKGQKKPQSKEPVKQQGKEKK